MTGAADPMMNFPYGTVFTPYSLVRNISEQSATLTPELWWMAAGSPQSATLPQMTLPPHQTLNLNAPALLAAAGLKDFNGSVNLILDTDAQAGGLLMSSGSVDQTNTYVFEVMPHGVVEGPAKELCYWSTGNGDDTMVTLWNPADEPQDFSFTLFYTGGQYVYPIHLGPRETRTMNVSDIVHTASPDAAGNVIPAGLTEGSAELAGSLGEQQEILVSLDASVYNVRKATCGEICWTCNGVVDWAVSLSPFAVATGGTTTEILYETNNSGYQNIATASWKSSATGIATVNSSGVVTGVSLGSLTLTALDLYQETVGGWFCTYVSEVCPIESVGGSAGGSVIPTISGPNTVWYFANLTVSGYATSITLTSSGGSSTTWNITAGANEITVSSFTGSSINVLSSGTAFSSSIGDVKLTATANGQTSSPFSITTRTPNRLVAGTIQNNCDSTWGYVTFLDYTIQDQFQSALPADVPVNEIFTTDVINDYSGTNWIRGTAGGSNTTGADFSDEIGGQDLNSSPVPVPTCDGNSTAVHHFGQDWRVGSLATGFGRRVQTDTLQRYIGHAAHTSIVSPAP